MKEINNLIYLLKISFVNKTGLDTSISIEFHDNGLKIKSVKVGKVCITEERINGRVLSGRIDNQEGYCGYRYDYQNGENLLNINPNININTAIDLINKSKWQTDFLTAELVLSSIVRNDYNVVILNEGTLSITKTVSAEDENAKQCCLKESIVLTKANGDGCFVEREKKSVYTIDDKFVEESQICELSDIISQSPQDYKELIEIKKRIEEKYEIGVKHYE